MSSSSNTTGRTGSTTWNERSTLISWLEDSEENFKLVTGGAGDGKAMRAGAKLKKIDGYRKMAIYINEKTGAKWTPEQARSRFRTVFDNYKETKRKYLDNTGEKYTLTESDISEGIKTLEQKLEKQCKCLEDCMLSLVTAKTCNHLLKCNLRIS